jgi:phosphoglycerate dehydrogenase-like enzyme
VLQREDERNRRWHVVCLKHRHAPIRFASHLLMSRTWSRLMDHPSGGNVIVLRDDPGQRHREQLAQAFPMLQFVLATTAETFEEVRDAAVSIIGGEVTTDDLRAAPRLKWIQAVSAGVDSYPIAELHERAITLTNFGGVAATNIAEHALALMLAFARGLKPLLALQHARQWGAADADLVTFELQDQVVGIIGMGEIGDELARRSHALGMHVLATQRHVSPHAPDYVERLLPHEALHEVLATADHVVLCLPLTAETRHTISAGELGRMRRTAYLYNVGRGDLIDQAALIEALQTGQIAGAGLDVTSPEPLPSDSPLWDLPNAIVTGHTAGATPRYWQRGIAVVEENLRRFVAGEALTNVVDTSAGY